jgi:hypothetical protein
MTERRRGTAALGLIGVEKVEVADATQFLPVTSVRLDGQTVEVARTGPTTLGRVLSRSPLLLWPGHGYDLPHAVRLLWATIRGR